jgi:hypothetical protein
MAKPLLEDRSPVSTYVDGETAARIDAEARARGLSRSAYVRTLLIQRMVENAPAITPEAAAVLDAAGMPRGEVTGDVD